MKRKLMYRLMLIALSLIVGGIAYASTTLLLSTTTYNGPTDTNASISSALPAYGPYAFTLSVTPVPAGASLTSMNVYLQQKGLSGALYTIVNSTFTSCSGICTQTVIPDVYEGGTIVPRWTVTSGSSTITINAISITP